MPELQNVEPSSGGARRVNAAVAEWRDEGRWGDELCPGGLDFKCPEKGTITLAALEAPTAYGCL